MTWKALSLFNLSVSFLMSSTSTSVKSFRFTLALNCKYGWVILVFQNSCESWLLYFLRHNQDQSILEYSDSLLCLKRNHLEFQLFLTLFIFSNLFSKNSNSNNAEQLYWNDTSAWVMYFPVDLVHIFRTSFSKNSSGWLLLIFLNLNLYDVSIIPFRFHAVIKLMSDRPLVSI